MRAITINTVLVGNPGNANDPGDGDAGNSGIQNYGAVSYAYRIGTTEVTVGQYTAFFNAVADTDTYALYNTSMGTDLNTSRIRGAASQEATSIAPRLAQHARHACDLGDAARFSNWLHNGQPTAARFRDHGRWRLFLERGHLQGGLARRFARPPPLGSSPRRMNGTRRPITRTTA